MFSLSLIYLTASVAAETCASFDDTKCGDLEPLVDETECDEAVCDEQDCCAEPKPEEEEESKPEEEESKPEKEKAEDAAAKVTCATYTEPCADGLDKKPKDTVCAGKTCLPTECCDHSCKTWFQTKTNKCAKGAKEQKDHFCGGDCAQDKCCKSNAVATGFLAVCVALLF